MKTIFTSVNKKHDKESAFTLIELMVVVVIIGILAAIAIPVFMNQQKSAIAASVKSDVKNNSAQIVASDGKLYEKPSVFAKKAVITDTNIAGYAVNSSYNEACVSSSRKISDTETISYKFLTSTGKISEGTCPDLGGESYSSDTSGSSTATPSPSGQIVANCGGGVYTVSGPATVTCAVAQVTGTTTNYTITVTGTSATPSIWTVQADWSGVTNFASAKGYAPVAFNDTGAITSKSYTFSGTDRSWNGDQTASNNYKYISTAKSPITFTSQVILK